MPEPTIGEHVRDEREWLGATHVQLAQAVGLAEADIAAFEDGTREPTDDQCVRLAKALRLDSPERLRGQPLAALDGPVILCGGEPTAEDRYHVQRFAEFLRNSGDPHA